jgi:integrase
MNALSFSLPKPTKFRGRNSYYFYLRIPKDLQKNYAPKLFIKISLHTDSLREAKARIMSTALEIEQQFQEYRRKNAHNDARAQALLEVRQKKLQEYQYAAQPYLAPFSTINETERKRLVLLYTHEKLKEDEEQARKVTPVTEEALQEWQETEQFLRELNKRKGLRHTATPAPRPTIGFSEEEKKKKERTAQLFVAASSYFIADGDFSIIEDDVDRFLAKHDIAAPADMAQKLASHDYLLFTKDIFIQELSIQKAILSRLHGEWIATPPLPSLRIVRQLNCNNESTQEFRDTSTSSIEVLQPSKMNPRFSTLWKEWQAVMGAKRSTISNYKSAIRRFVEFFDDPPVKAITPDMMHQFKKAVLRLPTHMNRTMQAMPIHKVLEWVDRQEAKGKLDLNNTSLEFMSAAAINKRVIAAISTVCKYAIKERYISANPCIGITVEAYEDNQRKRNKGSLINPVTAQRTNARLPYSLEDLKAIFAGNLFTGKSGLGTLPRGNRRYRSTEDKQVEYRWFIMLGLFTGARIEELGQALLDEIQEDEGTGQLYLFIRPDPETGWTPKTEEGSIRFIPIHPRLIELGFRQFIQRQKRLGARKLFKAIHTCEVAHERTNAFSKWWGRYTTEIGVKKGMSKSFHSFRHGLEFFLLNEARVNDSINKAILGHKEDGVHENYGRLEHGGRYTRQLLAEEIAKLRFGGVVDGKELERIMREYL